jgi:drug/metabolite transporter (DMT)-like permease
MNYFFPPILIVFGLVIYQYSQKTTDQDANPFLVVTLAYLFGIAICLVGYFVIPSNSNTPVLPMLKTVAWSALGIGAGAAAIEIGFMLAYRAGWNVSLLPISVNVISAAMLIVVGLLVFKESISLEKIAGIALCIAGFVLITLRK